MKKISIPHLKEMKARGEVITMITAYSAWQARLVDEAGAEMTLVGDSLAMVEKGYPGTLPVTVDVMVDACAAVTRGTSRSFVVGDMPFLSYEVDRAQAIANAGRFVKEAAVDAVKLEGGLERAETIRAIVGAGMAVVGHIGLTPQSATLLGGFRVQGRDLEGARRLLADAKAVEEAGACALVLECVPAPLARLISERLTIPTIGIGAGGGCDGQVLVFHDILGLYGDFRPRFVKRYVEGGKILKEALETFVDDVRRRGFPDEAHSFGLDEALIEELRGS
ncbi:3-methyl-2-oxobutanoate hydroxymethyltransferase [Aminithiophilus ramosus]|uniref:3-methyl-2-oxobutanoate hydroxymethyltransferase n=2 Tax=Synergistales TaxID=649776 RepID=A0A9Q7EZ04_9BACT|nr:3-methyl-2-oxobutanoate hydroxymethyltransferase [Aminithiophilus ramosus]QTX32576.1 3-methyl-2-oxobutanoate hydroxymethyltransferase [Aminithiophilus ramosus]QVL36456.1 3-methyl-2-oxobutanoate hydroxymethyltransferase [Synergistota bacterium]